MEIFDSGAVLLEGKERAYESIGPGVMMGDYREG